MIMSRCFLFHIRWFLATLITAVVALSLVTVISLVEFITYFTDQDDRRILQPYRGMSNSLITTLKI